ncbi:cilia- and flagella-associated protein 206 [Danio rerio]|uniref:cilia- and flagella-associated protein 206 n=1 Tax=Danio rerio TaxID=7955 RepID=UPI00001D996F|nr:cilia- and flagella-associated protein 206 [Danio rerio]AAQ97751.1 chromosome 6 open reading frame 165 [Danio rerio]|eukprot:NP_991180.1 cilia- and flagella-associated protein 206 [Danio rerio]
MSSSQAEGVIRNIIREISQTCLSRGQTLSETLIAFMVKAVVLDPTNHFNVDRTLTKQDVQKLIELCVDRLMDQTSPTLQTIKMQVYFDMNYTPRREFLEMQQKLLQSRLQSLSREITDSRAKSREDLKKLYGTIVHYIIQSSNLSSSTDINTVRETTAALQSIFPPSQLGSFMSLLKSDKEQQLKENSLIVSGIRLFNKDNGEGGEAIQSLPSILNEKLPGVVSDLERELASCERLCWQYTGLLEQISERDTAHSQSPVPPRLLTQALYNTRQHEAFLRLTLADVILCAQEVTRLQSDLMSRMTLLRDAIHTKTTVPTTHVFPHFSAVGRLWAGLEQEMLLLSMLTNVASGLRVFLTAESLLTPDQMELPVRTDADRCSGTAEERVLVSETSSCECCFPDSTADFQHLPLQYNGFCGVALVDRNGLLLPGNTSIGVLKHKEKYYAFSSRSAAYEFSCRADEYTAAVLETASRTPELIQLLQLQQHFTSSTAYSQLPAGHQSLTAGMPSGQKLLLKSISKSDAGVQTEIHPLQSNICTSYEWNEWEMRRKAIKLANLHSKVTRSSQSDWSLMRRHNSSQTFLPKDASCQTKRDGQSLVPKAQVYLSGLRGAAGFRKVDLSRAVDE